MISPQRSSERAFLSTLPARGATEHPGLRRLWSAISIHAPREGSDACPWVLVASGSLISIHAPREGSDRPAGGPLVRRLYFYPRSPRGERHKEGGDACQVKNFYPRSPRGERRKVINIYSWNDEISIHAPREGSDGTLVI